MSLETLLASDAATLSSVLEPLFAPKSPTMRRSSNASTASFKAALLSIPVEGLSESNEEELPKAEVALNGDTEDVVSIQEVLIDTQYETNVQSAGFEIEAGGGSEMNGPTAFISNPIPEIREEEAS